MTPVVSYIAGRMKEPSTWAGLSAILVAFKVLPNEHRSNVNNRWRRSRWRFGDDLS